MDKIIGKVLLFILLTISQLSAQTEPRITLRIVSSNGDTIETVEVGEPFRLEVLIEGMGQNAPRNIDIPGINRINARRNGYFLTTINGVSSVRYNYHAQMDRLGYAWIGPVVVTHEGKQIQSNKLKIVAKADDGAAPQKNVKRKEYAEALLRLYVDKKDVVVGEKINARLRFYTSGQNIEPRQLNTRDLPAFTMSAMEGPSTGQDTIDGQPYQYVEWRWQMYPKEAGKLIIPAYSIDYDKITQRQNQWSSFLSLFGSRMESKQAHSNAQVINVKQLPLHNGDVFLVGKLTECSAEISPTHFAVGDAATLSIEIEGEGNLENTEHLDLTGMPENVKFYESKSIMVPQSKNSKLSRKRFEFVIQGIKEGVTEIPAQTFTYYDVESKTYQQKSTQPLTITIVPGAEQPAVIPATREEEKEEALQELGPINTHGPWNGASAQKAMPWWLFILLLILPLIVFVSLPLYTWVSAWYLKHSKIRSAYKHAHQQLVLAQTAKDSRRIYYIMKSAIADRKKIALEAITPEYMHQILQSAGMQPEKLSEWDDFALLLTQQVYAYHDHKPELFSAAHQWLNEWEKLV